MRIIIFSDIHGNIDVLETLIKKEHNADYFLCLGDVVGYGPFANECLAKLSSLKNCGYIMGNHEEMFIAGTPHPNCSTFACEFFKYSYPLFDKKYLPLLKDLPLQLDVESFTAIHTLLDKYIYPNTPAEVFGLLQGKYFIGHSHCQFMTTLPGLTIVNPGSLGQNRKNKSIASYVVWEPEKSSFAFENFSYNNEKFCSEMLDKKYPIELVNYYRT